MHKKYHEIINDLITQEIASETNRLSAAVVGVPEANLPPSDPAPILARLTDLTAAQAEFNAVKVFKRG